jgi:hypothetical protein
VDLQRLARFDLKGAGRFGIRPGGASVDLLLTGSEAAWATIAAAQAELIGTWTDDEELEGLLAAAGWAIRRPKRTRLLGGIFSHGELRATAAVYDAAALRPLLAVAGETPVGAWELAVSLRSHDPQAPRVTLTLAEQADVLEVLADGTDSQRAVTDISDAVKRAGPEVGLRVSERPHER